MCFLIHEGLLVGRLARDSISLRHSWAQGRSACRPRQIPREKRQGHDPAPAQQRFGRASVAKNGTDALPRTETRRVVAPAPKDPRNPASGTNAREDLAWSPVPQSAPPGPPRAPDRDRAGHEPHRSGSPVSVCLADPWFTPGCWVAPRCWARSLQPWASNRRAPRREATNRLAETRASAFPADQDVVTQGLAGPQHVGSPRPTICNHDDLVGANEWREPPTVCNRDAHGRLLTADALDIQRRRPPAGLFRQQRHHRAQPATAEGRVCPWHVRDVDGASILAGFGFWTLQWAPIDRHPDEGIVGPFSQHTAHTQRVQPLDRDLSIGQPCRHAGPRPSTTWRERAFRKRSRVHVAPQAIAQGKQYICPAFQAVRHLLTTFDHGVKVPVESAPGLFLPSKSTPPGTLLHGIIACASFCLNIKPMSGVPHPHEGMA